MPGRKVQINCLEDSLDFAEMEPILRMGESCKNSAVATSIDNHIVQIKRNNCSGLDILDFYSSASVQECDETSWHCTK